MGSPRPLTPVLLSALLWGCAGAQGHQHGTSLPPRFQGTDAVQVSVHAVSLKDGRVICSSRPRLLMRPASTMKLVTTIPLCIERSDMSVVTRMQAQRPDGGTLRLLGGADPLLSTEDLKRMVSELRSKGLNLRPRVEIAEEDGTFFVHAWHESHRQIVDLEVTWTGRDGQSLHLSPTGEFIAQDLIHARAGLLLHSTGERPIELMKFHLPPEFAEGTLAAVLQNPNSRTDPLFSMVSHKVLLRVEVR